MFCGFRTLGGFGLEAKDLGSEGQCLASQMLLTGSGKAFNLALAFAVLEEVNLQLRFKLGQSPTQ